MPKIRKMKELLRPPGRSQSTARERAIARSGKKGQLGPLARLLKKSKTGKPSPHVDRPKPRKRMTTDDLKAIMGKRKKAGKASPMAMKKGGPASKSPARIAPKLGGMGRLGSGEKKPKRKTVTTTFHESKKRALKDKGKPNTPGEKMRTFKGKYAAGQAHNKKMFRGDFDIGKKIRYQRRGK